MNPEPSDAQLQAKARQQRLAQAFAAVFGQERKRTAEQRLVMEHLTICAGDDGNSYRFNEARDGVALIAAGLHRDGAKSLLKVIERQLAIAGQVRPEKPPKPVSKRQ